MEDTIVAISTSLGLGAISIVRLSGSESLNIVNKIFNGKDLTKVPSHTIHYGYIIDNDKKIDEVLVSVMKSPKTYTTEDIVEINTHGGIISTNKVLELCLKNGARLAEPGEFTKRAFLNGRLDLTEAEAVQELISAQSEQSLNLFMNQLTGSLKELITSIRHTIMTLIANIEVNIDFPEYEDAENITIPLLKEKITPIKTQLLKLLAESKNAKIIKDGINIALIGRPNVGKSSLLNLLIEENKAIVTDIAGTTRDIVEGSIILSGIKLNFIDTAGIRQTNDIVEQLGVKKSKETVAAADLVILLLNNNEDITPEDQELINLLHNKKHLIFINKTDLPTKIDISQLPQDHLVYGNTLNPSGCANLKKEIIKLFNLEQINTPNATYLTNARQNALISQSINLLDNTLQEINNGDPVDLIEIDLRSCWDTLGEIIGATYKDELLDELFSNFCLGK